MNERDIFDAALAISDSQQRAAFLDQACGQNETQRREVEEMLDAQERLGSFLQGPPAGLDVTIESPILEKPGTQVGPYKLLQVIGEGGFGVVYMAEQHKPLRRKVALKIIKPSMDTKEVIARFEAERQALALMDHPNIAKVLDGGTTEAGRPYFVMELVKGVPVTEFCDDNQLDTHSRVSLFVSVCRAIQHAHHKGVIHRDIKPSNVLVTLHDGEPVPRVIDFGVAKAISQQLTEKTMFTAFGQMIGTPQYMSPEQAEMSGLDIDTRSDVYSLGVLLYELLTGTTPLDPRRLRETAFHEMQRIIREEEPHKPSTRLTTVGEQSEHIAANRGTSPEKLGQLMRGDLDWIVMRALEKNRERRYDTANAFAEDVERFLKREPVEACPPSLGYRMKKYIQRNRQALIVLGTINALLFVGIVVSFVLAVKMLNERDRANANKALAERHLEQVEAKAVALASTVNFLMREFNPYVRQNGDLKVRQLLERIAESSDSDLPKDLRAQAAIRHNIGVICHRAGMVEQSQSNLQRALELRQEVLGKNHVETARTQFALAYALLDFRLRYQSPELNVSRAVRIAQLGNAAIETLEKTLGPNHRETLHALAFKAFAISYMVHDIEQAEVIYEELRSRAPNGLTLSQNDPLDLLGSVFVLIHRDRVGRDEQIDAEIERRYQLACQRLPEQHPQRAFWMAWYGQSLYFQGKVDESRRYLKRAYELRKEVLGSDNYFTFLCGRALAALVVRQGDVDQGIDLLEEVLKHAEEHASQNLSLGALYLIRNQSGDREKWLRVARRMLDKYEFSKNVASVNNTLEVCLIVPAQSEPERQMQRRAIKMSRDFRKHDRRAVDDPAHYGLRAHRRRFTIALAEYRDGKFSTCAKRLEQVVIGGLDENKHLQYYRAYGFALLAAIAANDDDVPSAKALLEKAEAARKAAPDWEVHHHQYFSWNRQYCLTLLKKAAEAAFESPKARTPSG